MAPTRRSFSRALTRVVLLGLVCQGLMLFIISSTRAQTGTPLPGDWFKYQVKQTLRDGTGYFEYYKEDTHSTGMYDITAVGENLTVHATYSWTWSGYDSWEEERYSGSGNEDRTVNVTLATRHYAQIQTDLDEYDHLDGRNLAVWFWVPANLEVGDTVEILDAIYTVTNEQATIWSNGVPRVGVELKAQGTNTHFNYDDKNWSSTF